MWLKHRMDEKKEMRAENHHGKDEFGSCTPLLVQVAKAWPVCFSLFGKKSV
jgi:hypothetical protein